MLCENCKEREATVHFTEIMNGRVQKHHLCKECAAQMEMMGYASNEVPFVKLLTGMLAAGQTQEQGENPLQYVRCPKCGMTYEEFTRVKLRLKEAVMLENFEAAAKYRDEIKALQAKEEHNA